VHCAETAEYIDTTAPYLSQIVLIFSLHRSLAQWPQWTAYRKPPLLCRMVPSLIPIRPPLLPRAMSPFAKILWLLLLYIFWLRAVDYGDHGDHMPYI